MEQRSQLGSNQSQGLVVAYASNGPKVQGTICDQFLDQQMFLAKTVTKMKTYLLCGFIKPVSDVSSCRKNNWIALGLAIVVKNQFSNIKYLIEKRNPAVIMSIVLSYFFRSVVIAEFVWSRIAHRIFSWQ